MSLEEMKQEDRDLLGNLVMGMHEYGQQLGAEIHDRAMEDLNARHYYEKAIRLLGVPIPRYETLSSDEREDVRGWSNRGLSDVLMLRDFRDEDDE